MEEDAIMAGGRSYTIVYEATKYRTASAKLNEDKIVIRIPANIGAAKAQEISQKLRDRILRKLSNGTFPVAKAEIAFEDKQLVKIGGQSFTIAVIASGSVRMPRAHMDGNNITITLPDRLSDTARRSAISRTVRLSLSYALAPVIEARVQELNSVHFGSKLGVIRLKDNVSNWGSCSKRNNINLDFRLLFAPREVMDAVILHELAHTHYRNHSKEFYRLLLNAMPDYKGHMRWLISNADKLKPDTFPSMPPM